MKKSLIIVLLLCNGFLLAQEPLTIKEIDSTSSEVPFNITDKVPIYKGCDASLSNRELKECMNTKITELIFKKFNKAIGIKTNLKHGSNARVNIIFKIDTLGMVQNVKVFAPHPALEKEAIRVINLIPKMQPGYHDGKPVTVPYALPIIVYINNPKPNKSKTNSTNRTQW